MPVPTENAPALVGPGAAGKSAAASADPVLASFAQALQSSLEPASGSRFSGPAHTTSATSGPVSTSAPGKPAPKPLPSSSIHGIPGSAASTSVSVSALQLSVNPSFLSASSASFGPVLATAGNSSPSDVQESGSASSTAAFSDLSAVQAALSAGSSADIDPASGLTAAFASSSGSIPGAPLPEPPAPAALPNALPLSNANSPVPENSSAVTSLPPQRSSAAFEAPSPAVSTTEDAALPPLPEQSVEPLPPPVTTGSAPQGAPSSSALADAPSQESLSSPAVSSDSVLTDPSAPASTSTAFAGTQVVFPVGADFAPSAAAPAIPVHPNLAKSVSAASAAPETSSAAAVPAGTPPTAPVAPGSNISQEIPSAAQAVIPGPVPVEPLAGALPLGRAVPHRSAASVRSFVSPLSASVLPVVSPAAAPAAPVSQPVTLNAPSQTFASLLHPDALSVSSNSAPPSASQVQAPPPTPNSSANSGNSGTTNSEGKTSSTAVNAPSAPNSTPGSVTGASTPAGLTPPFPAASLSPAAPTPAATSPASPGDASALADSLPKEVSSSSAAAHPSSTASLPSLIPGDNPDLPAGLRAWNAGEGLQAQVTSSVQLLEKLGRSEMNIALQAEALGAVQVHAHVSGDQVGASITVDRHDVHALLASDLPSLHQALGDRQLRFDSISLQHSTLLGAGAGAGDNAARQQSQQGGSSPTPFQGDSLAGASIAAPPMLNWETTTIAEARPIFDSQGRLSVRA